MRSIHHSFIAVMCSMCLLTTSLYTIANDWFAQGNEYLVNNEYDNAIEAYSKAIQINPNYADAYINRGRAFFL